MAPSEGDSRFFNVKHPARYAKLCAEGWLPVQEAETLSEHDRHVEDVMLGIRLKEGIAADLLGAGGVTVAERYCELGLLRRVGARIALTDAGRLLADGIVTDILLGEE